MKHIALYVITALFSLSVAAQADTAQQKEPVEAVPLLSYSEYVKAMNSAVADIPTKYGDEVRAKFFAVWQQLVRAYEEKKKLKK